MTPLQPAAVLDGDGEGAAGVIDRAPRQRARTSTKQAGIDLLVGVALILSLQLPVLLTKRAFFGDWGNHLFLLGQQTNWLRSHLLPTYFVHTVDTDTFYPHFLFYGGTLYSVIGRLAAVFGVVAMYKLSFVAATGVCYFGTVWTARLLGVAGLVAHLPALVAISGAYYLSIEYYSGDWPEFVAISLIPPVVASILSLLLTRRRLLAPMMALASSIIVLTGSHNITTEYGLIFLGLVAGIVLFAVRPARLVWRRAAVVGATMAFALGVNAWFLLPAARYAHLTRIGARDNFDVYDQVIAPMNTWTSVFNPLRIPARLHGRTADPYYVQEPILVLLWLLVLVCAVASHASGMLRRLTLGLSLLLSAYLVLIMWRGPWDHLPAILRLIQFRFRLHSYVGYATVALIIVALVAIQEWRSRKLWISALAVACAAAFVASVWQAWSAPTYLSTAEITRDRLSLPPIDYASCPEPCSLADTDYRMNGTELSSAAAAVGVREARTGSARFGVQAGRPTALNVTWSPVIRTTPAAPIVGANPEGLAVVSPRGFPNGEAVESRVRFRGTNTTSAGIAVTSVCCLILTAMLVIGVARRCLAPGQQITAELDRS